MMGYGAGFQGGFAAPAAPPAGFGLTAPGGFGGSMASGLPGAPAFGGFTQQPSSFASAPPALPSLPGGPLGVLPGMPGLENMSSTFPAIGAPFSAAPGGALALPVPGLLSGAQSGLLPGLMPPELPGFASSTAPIGSDPFAFSPQASIPLLNDAASSGSGVSVSNCSSPTLQSVVNGHYHRFGENHLKPVYRRDEKSTNGADVLLYYWDDRDGPNFSGWYFGPIVGGDQVWAHHGGQPDDTKPPSIGWHVPFGGNEDVAFRVHPRVVENVAKRPADAPGGAAPPLKQMRLNEPPAVQSPWQPPPPPVALLPGQPPPPGSPQHLQQLQQQQQAAAVAAAKNAQRQQQLLQLYPQLAFNPAALQQYVQQLAMQDQLQEEVQKQRLAELKKKQEDIAKQRAEENAKRLEDMKQRVAKEGEAAARIMKFIQRVRVSQVDNFDEVKKELEEAMEKEKDPCGAQFTRMRSECDRAITQATKSIENILLHRKLIAERKVAEDLQKKQLDERKCALKQALCDLADKASAKSSEIKVSAAHIERGFQDIIVGIFEPHIDDETMSASVKALDRSCTEAEELVQHCSISMLEKGSDLKELGGPDPRTPRQPSEIHGAVGTLLQQIKDLSTASQEVKVMVRIAEEALRKRQKAKSDLEEVDRVFKKYDVDGDGMLSRREAGRFTKMEFSFDLPSGVLDTVWRDCVDVSDCVEEPGVRQGDFRWAQIAIGIARETARDQLRLQDRLEREAIVQKLKSGPLEPGMREVAAAALDVESVIVKVEQKISPLKNSKVSDIEAANLLAHEAEIAIAEGKDAVTALRKRIDSLATDGIEERCQSDIREHLTVEMKVTEGLVGRMLLRLERAETLARRFRQTSLWKHEKANEAQTAAEQAQAAKAVVEPEPLSVSDRAAAAGRVAWANALAAAKAVAAAKATPLGEVLEMMGMIDSATKEVINKEEVREANGETGGKSEAGEALPDGETSPDGNSQVAIDEVQDGNCVVASAQENSKIPSEVMVAAKDQSCANHFAATATVDLIAAPTIVAAEGTAIGDTAAPFAEIEDNGIVRDVVTTDKSEGNIKEDEDQLMEQSPELITVTIASRPMGLVPIKGSDSDGYVVAKVTEGKPAAIAGIKPGWRLVKVADRPCRDLELEEAQTVLKNVVLPTTMEFEVQALKPGSLAAMLGEADDAMPQQSDEMTATESTAQGAADVSAAKPLTIEDDAELFLQSMAQEFGES